VRGYLAYLDSGLARASSDNDVARVDLLLVPMFAIGIVTALPAVILRLAGASGTWLDRFGWLLFGLAALHLVALFWRWSIFNGSEDEVRTQKASDEFTE
jgi:hypothetical protein